MVNGEWSMMVAFPKRLTMVGNPCPPKRKRRREQSAIGLNFGRRKVIINLKVSELFTIDH
jgi:hypothetical protein